MKLESYISDQDLWNLFLSGNRKAFSEIYNRHYNDLFAYGMKILGDKEVVRDCIQDLFVKIYIHRNSLSSTTNINAYLIHSLRNTAYNTLRGSTFTDELSAVPFYLFDDQDLIEELFPETDNDLENKLKLKRILEELSDKQREIIHLRFVQELSLEEISEILEINYQSVKNLLHRTIVKIRNAYIFQL